MPLPHLDALTMKLVGGLSLHSALGQQVAVRMCSLFGSSV